MYVEATLHLPFVLKTDEIEENIEVKAKAKKKH
jgi:hypothetical protein